MHLQDAMFSTLKIYFYACLIVYAVIAIVLAFSYIIHSLREPDEPPIPTKDLNPFRYNLSQPRR